MTTSAAASLSRPLIASALLLTALAASAPAALAQSAPPQFEETPAGFALTTKSVRLDVGGDGSVRFAPVLSEDPGFDPAVRYELESIGFGDSRTPLAGSGHSPQLDSPERLTIPHGQGIAEIYVPRGIGIEQLFTLAELPPAAGGDLVLEGRLRGGYDLRLRKGGRDGLTLERDGRQFLHYGAATVIDADGKRLDARMEVAGDLVRIVMDAAWVAEARLPITVDPLIIGTIVISVAGTLETRTDCAYSTTQNAYIVVYDDQDVIPRIMAARYDFLGLPIDPDPAFITDAFIVTQTAGVRDAKVAWLGGGVDKYLVAWRNTSVVPNQIQGAIITADSGVAPPAIQPIGAIATQGGSEAGFTDLAVGGRQDGVGWVVAYSVTRTAGGAFTRAQLVSPAGTLVGGAIALSGTSSPHPARRNVSVNKLAGAGFGWCFAWSQQISPTTGTDFNIFSVTLTAAGARGNINTNIAATAEVEDNPSVTGSGSQWFIAWTVTDATTDRDIRARLTHPSGTGSGSAGAPTAVDIAASINDDERTPAAGSPGNDFLVAWTNASSSVAESGHIRFVRLDASLAIVEGPTAIADVVTDFLLPSVVARQGQATAANASEYMIAYERIFSLTPPLDNDPRFAIIQGLLDPTIEVREGSSTGLPAANGEPAIGLTARNFGGRQINTGASAPVTIAVTNIGGGTVTLGAPALVTPTTEFVIDAGSFVGSLTSGQTRTFTATFNPTVIGTRKATLTFTHTATTGLGAQLSPYVVELLGVGLNGPPVVVSGTNSTPVSIPDGTSFATSVITLPPGGEVLAVTVTLTIMHTFDGDLQIGLAPPSNAGLGGPIFALSLNNGGGGDNYIGTIFCDDPTAPFIFNSLPPFSGRHQPEAPLGVHRGEVSGGPWTLVMIDTAATDVGTLTAWSIDVDTAPVPGQPAIQVLEGGTTITSGSAASGGRIFAPQLVGAPASELTIEVTNSGGGALTVGTPMTTPGDFAINATGFTSPIPPGETRSFKVNFAPTAFGTRTGTVSFTHDAPTAGQTFSFDVEGFGLLAPPTARSSTGGGGLPVPIEDGFAVPAVSTAFCSLGGQVLSVTVSGVNIEHAFPGDLAIFLVAPDGTTRALSLGHGLVFSTGYVNTTFTDSAATPIAAGTPPFTGSFRPDEPLVGFQGVPAFGEWRLEVEDSLFPDYGTIESWTLEITATETGVATTHLRVSEGVNGFAIARGASGAAAVRLGPVQVGQISSPKTISVENAGGNTLTVSAPTAVNANDFDVVASGFDPSIAGRVGKTLQVAFSPAAGTSGPIATTVQFDHNAAGPAASTQTPFIFDIRGVAVAEFVTVNGTGTLPLAIPDPGRVTSTSTVLNRAGNVLSAVVTVNIAHDFVGDLDLQLVHPDGTHVSLLGRNFAGSLNFGIDMTGTIFADDAPRFLNDFGELNAPFTGRFRPTQEMATALAGKGARGAWGLAAEDFPTPFPFVGGSGDVVSWSLELGLSPAPGILLTESPGGLAVSPGQAAVGTGRAFAARAVSAPPSAPLTIVIQNNGTQALDITGTPALSGTGASHFTLTGAAAGQVAAGLTTQFEIRFDPSAAGSHVANVTFPHTAGAFATSPFSFEVTGTGEAGTLVVRDGAGVSGPVLASGATIDFGTQGTNAGPTAFRFVTVQNTGNQVLTLGTPAISGPNAGEFTTDISSFNPVVQPGGSTVFSGRFDPSGAGGRSATITMTHDGIGNPTPFVLNLSGTGVATLTAGGGGGGGGGGGCQAAPGAANPALPALVLAAMGLLALRRRRG